MNSIKNELCCFRNRIINCVLTRCLLSNSTVLVLQFLAMGSVHIPLPLETGVPWLSRTVWMTPEEERNSYDEHQKEESSKHGKRSICMSIPSPVLWKTDSPGETRRHRAVGFWLTGIKILTRPIGLTSIAFTDATWSLHQRDSSK